MTKTKRLIGFVVGGLLFIVAHLIEVRLWAPWFGRSHNAWFISDQHTAQFMVGYLFITSLIAGWFRLSGFMIALGACAAMAGVVFTFPDGPGNLFPIALAVGGTLVTIACWTATWIGTEFRGFVTRRRLTH